jgi:hypothetical protein
MLSTDVFKSRAEFGACAGAVSCVGGRGGAVQEVQLEELGLEACGFGARGDGGGELAGRGRGEEVRSGGFRGEGAGGGEVLLEGGEGGAVGCMCG